MEAQLLRRPAAAASSAARTWPSSTSLLKTSRPINQQLRYKATVNRHKRALNVPPHPSFLASGSGQQPAPQTDHIIYNPPSSEPSIFHTPFKFLPRSDPRRRANLPALFSSLTPSPATDKLPPLLPFLPTPEQPKIHHLTPKDVEQMRQLRAEDPVTNSVIALSNRFGCSKQFVMMCCHAPAEHQEKHKERLAAIRDRWGPTRTKAREDRYRRKQMLLRGEI